MRWPWLPPSRDVVLAIAVGIVIVSALSVAVIKFPQLGWGLQGGYTGFDPDWDCTPIPRSQPVCIKRVPAAPPNRATKSN
jgi:hypothetical protein